MKIFKGAEEKLKKLLERDNEFRIAEVEQIQILGRHIDNSDVIEDHIENEYSDSEEKID